MVPLNGTNRQIGTDEKGITEFVTLLSEDKYLIPSFQREFVWTPEEIIKLWDSIYRFYPIGSMITWETDICLRIHRRLGGFICPNDEKGVLNSKKRVYILDGQQRATSLLVSLFGGQAAVKDREGFDYTVFFDTTNATFFFKEAYNRRRRSVPPEFLIRLGDALYRDRAPCGHLALVPGYNPAVETNLRHLNRVFSEYKIALIYMKGFDIPAVREIFERINQEGRDLKSIDIMIARTFRNYEYMVEEDL